MTDIVPTKSQLVTAISTAAEYTLRRESDVRTALTRALAEYLEGVVVNAIGGRQIRFLKVLSTWAEAETVASYPSAIVYAPAAGLYDASKFVDTPNQRNRIAGTDKYLLSHSEYVLDVNVEIWTNDPVERRELVAGLEGAFNPVPWMYGFKLTLPHYYGEFAVFELKDSQYMDTEEDAMRRYRKASFTLTGQVPVMNVFEFPPARPKIRLDEVGPAVVIPNLVVQDC